MPDGAVAAGGNNRIVAAALGGLARVARRALGMSALRVRVDRAPRASTRTTSSTSGEPAMPAPGFSTRKKRRRMLDQIGEQPDDIGL